MNTTNPIRVVVVDDESPETIADKLREPHTGEPDLVVTPITNVEAARRHFEEHDLDVAVIDMVMPNGKESPERAGLYLLERLRKLRPNAEAIVLTAYGSHANTVEAMERGAFGYVDKTVEGWNILRREVYLAAERKAQRKEIERLLRQKFLSEMAAKVFHDMNSPLAVVLMSAELGEMSGITGRGIELLQQIQIAGKRMKVMLEEILEIARGNPKPINKMWVPFATFLKQHVEHFRLLCWYHRVRFEWENDFAGTVELDEARMLRVLENLILNAARAVQIRWQGNEQGRVLLRCRAATGQLVIEVIDNGNGVSKELCDHLFSAIRPQDIIDHGLGLVVCKEIVEQHGGTISVASEPGSGTTFTITLPA